LRDKIDKPSFPGLLDSGDANYRNNRERNAAIRQFLKVLLRNINNRIDVWKSHAFADWLHLSMNGMHHHFGAELVDLGV